MVRPIGGAPTCLSLDEVMLHAGHEVLLKINDIRALIVCNFRPTAQVLPNQLIKYYYSIIYLLFYILIFQIIKLVTNLSGGGN
jgi:hypothetical protein